MTQQRFDQWLHALGYDPAAASLHLASSQLTPRHPYAPELHDLLNPQGEIRAEAVFDVEGVPTVSFFVDDGSLLSDSPRLDALRQRIWNQGLVSVLLVIREAEIVPVPVAARCNPGAGLPWAQARRDGPLSRADIQSGDIRERHADWFNLEERVDRKLLANLRSTVNRLAKIQIDAASGTQAPEIYGREDAQSLVGQVLFVSYLEHRDIVSTRYRQERGVGRMHDLVAERDREGVVRLFDQLKQDFNGDFLEREDGTPLLWAELPEAGYAAIGDLLAATDIDRQQPSFFPYNFRFIPVELLSGVYESFLGKDDKKKLAAYYTPRHLANLVVDQALSGSKDLLTERIYDGACGSGILLTTAFRRLLGEAEARRGGQQIPLKERITLLKEHIWGSDLSEAACRVTAFSLYLSLLERLQPSDIVALCDDAKTKLPTLRGQNLYYGDDKGDFFSPHNPLAQRNDYTLLLSNPPWMEVSASEGQWVQSWAEQSEHPRSLKQIAIDFAWRASEITQPGARLCLILPMTMLLKPSSQKFLSAWLERVRWHRVINFGDLKELMFVDGRASCVVLLAERRQPADDPTGSTSIPGRETFEYWAPKADVSIAFGRLTLHGVDRHVVQTQAIARSNRELVTRMWGDAFDLALWAKLRLRGTFTQMFTGRNRRWRTRKGFHRTDNSPTAVRTPSDPLHGHRFIEPAMLYDSPVVVTTEADPFPKNEIPEITGNIDDLLAIFDGPRIAFPDGPAPDGTVRAAFMKGQAAFMSSIGTIAGPPEDEDLLRFAAIYLRSDLVRYFGLMQLYQLLSDRDRISLRDIGAFPFHPPEHHPQPDRARAIVLQVADISRELERSSSLCRPHDWLQRKPDLDKLIEEYFGLEGETAEIVRETNAILRPQVRPYGLSKVFENAGRRVDDAMAARYANSLKSELEAWRDARGGKGEFQVKVRLTNIARAGAFGVVEVRVGKTVEADASSERSDLAVDTMVRGLHQAGLLPVQAQEEIYLAADTVIISENTVYYVKPQTQRMWLLRQAHRDAERIVRATLSPTPAAKEVA